jgi:hypothetical protein
LPVLGRRFIASLVGEQRVAADISDEERPDPRPALERRVDSLIFHFDRLLLWKAIIWRAA